MRADTPAREPEFHTAALRKATGLDRGARQLIVSVVIQSSDLTVSNLTNVLFRDRYGNFTDYASALSEVHGPGVANTVTSSVSEARHEAEYGFSFDDREEVAEASNIALHLSMPEEDFRLMIEESFAYVDRGSRETAGRRIAEICRARGLPWTFGFDFKFQWVGDRIVEETVLEPAHSVIQDERFSGGVQSEFNQARAELRTGTPVSRKQAIQEAGSAVESAMKVVLIEHGITVDERQTAQRLFETLLSEGFVERRLERILLGPATPRNKSAAHGAGPIAHDPSPAEAQAVVASAAVAITFLHSLLPQSR